MLILSTFITELGKITNNNQIVDIVDISCVSFTSEMTILVLTVLPLRCLIQEWPRQFCCHIAPFVWVPNFKLLMPNHPPETSNFFVTDALI